MSKLDTIHWPERFKPSNSPVYVRNEIFISATADEIWAWLIRAVNWPSWYRNSANVRLLNQPGLDLALNIRFKWRTFGIPLKSEVLEFVPAERIAWNGHAYGIDVYHAWLIRPSQSGCHVLTEETQHGWLARINDRLMPNRMSRYHQIWLEALKDNSLKGPPPNTKTANPHRHRKHQKSV